VTKLQSTTKVHLIIGTVVICLCPATLGARKHESNLCSVSEVWFPDYSDNFIKPDLEVIFRPTISDIEAGRQGDDEVTVREKNENNAREEAKFKMILERKQSVESATWLKVVTWGHPGAGTLVFGSAESGTYSHDDAGPGLAIGRTGSDTDFTLTLKDADGNVVWQKARRQFAGIKSYAGDTSAGAYEVYVNPDKAYGKLLKKLGEDGHKCGKL